MNKDIFNKNAALLSERTEQERMMIPGKYAPMPQPDEIDGIARLVKTLIFPGFFDCRQCIGETRSFHVGVNMELLWGKLRSQIAKALLSKEYCSDEEEAAAKACTLADSFIDCLPELKRMLYTDVQAIYGNDPAVDNYSEVIFCYPVIEAMVCYRTAHALLELGVPIIPRILTELAHSRTGIDIHPGATIGEYFAIDHGTGVVIGETSIIGKHVTIYQGVTLGARNFTFDEQGHPVDIPRHPIVEDNVTIYSNTSLLGRITIGHDTIIGGNIWLTHSVPPNSRIVQYGKDD